MIIKRQNPQSYKHDARILRVSFLVFSRLRYMQERFPVCKIDEILAAVKVSETDSLADRDEHSDNSLVRTTCLREKIKYDASEIRKVTDHEEVR